MKEMHMSEFAPPSASTTPSLAGPPAPTVEPPKRKSRRTVVIIVVVIVAIASYLGVRVGLTMLQTLFPASQVHENVIPPKESKEYVSETQGYSVIAPGTPQIARFKDTSGEPVLVQNQTIWNSAGNGFFVGTVDFSDLDIGDVDAVLDASAQSMLDTAPGSSMRSLEKATFQGEPAVAGIYDLKGGKAQRFLVVLHKNIQYVLVTSVTDDDSDDTFFDSFTFLD
jgi:hypothetical protein